jgi:hypothetical protein
VQILERLDRRVASPSALAGQLELPVGIVAYHVRRLVELGWLRLVSQRARRGSVEHFYTAAALPAWDQLLWPWDRVLHELDDAGEATVLERLELVAIELTRLLNAAAWALSLQDRQTLELRTVRGIDTTLSLDSERRVERQTGDDSYALADFSATARALAKRGGFVAFRDSPDDDPAERAILAELGYDAVLATSATAEGESYLLEIYADAQTPNFTDALLLARLLTTQAACARAATAPSTHPASQSRSTDSRDRSAQGANQGRVKGSVR